MQLPQNIPTLGGLGEPPQRSRREQLAADGDGARRQIGDVLLAARRRAIALGAARGLAVLVGWFCLRSPLQRAAAGARDPRLLARLIGGPSDLLSSVELSREQPAG